MKKLRPAFCFTALILFFSCTALPRVQEGPPEPAPQGRFREAALPPLSSGGPAPGEEVPPETAPAELPSSGASAGVAPDKTAPPGGTFSGGGYLAEAAPAETLFPGRVPEKPVIPPVPELILGEGLTKPENLAAFLLSAHPEAEKDFVESLALYYMEEAAGEGVNHDTAFAQMCLETGFLRFGGLVTPDMNNFCGLGFTGPGRKGESFPDARTGVRAHIQHLKAYATDEPPKQELVDPRYFWVSYGSSPSISGLSGTWAKDADYAVKIRRILERLYAFSFGS